MIGTLDRSVRTPLIVGNEEELEIWDKAHELVLAVYALTKEFSGDDRFALALQMRRAAVAIADDIIESVRTLDPGDKGHFITMAVRAADECRHYLKLAARSSPTGEPTAEVVMTELHLLLTEHLRRVEKQSLGRTVHRAA